MNNAKYDPQTVFLNSKLVAKVKKNALEEIKILILTNNKIDIRTYFYFPNDPDPKPTKKGIWLSFEHIPLIIEAFEKMTKNPNEETSVDLEKNDRNQTKVYTNEYMGNKLVHIRSFYFKDNEFKPGKGISFKPAILPDLIEALHQTEKMKPETAL